MAWELPGVSKAYKKKVFQKGEQYYYIYFLGTCKSARGRGLCSELIKHYQSIAAAQGLPIWLEAGTEYAMKLYQKNGFIVVDELPLGKGKAAANGSKCDGGPGFHIWGMIWRLEPSASGEASGE